MSKRLQASLDKTRRHGADRSYKLSDAVTGYNTCMGARSITDLRTSYCLKRLIATVWLCLGAMSSDTDHFLGKRKLCDVSEAASVCINKPSARLAGRRCTYHPLSALGHTVADICFNLKQTQRTSVHMRDHMTSGGRRDQCSVPVKVTCHRKCYFNQRPWSLWGSTEKQGYFIMNGKCACRAGRWIT
jgi:hypothetical protein